MVSENYSRSYPGMKDLELRNIYKSFDGTPVLNDLSIDIFKSELCCLLGPSGCGKTTMLKIINGLLDPDRGSVVLDDQDITKLPPQKRNLGMVFQNYALFPHLNVFDNVAYGLKRRHISAVEIQNKVNAALELVRLSDFEKRRVHELSGGQQQRVALARAIVIEPRLLLLDEPLSNLDARLRADMRDEIKRIQTQLGITTVYVTHDQEEAMSIADRIVVMNNGNIEQIGTPVEIYENPATSFVASFVGNINFIPGEISGNELSMLGTSYQISPDQNMTGNVTCALRPERIELSSGSEADIKGIITDVRYFGSSVRYDVEVTYQGNSQTVTVQSAAALIRFEKGNQVNMVIDKNDIRIFPAR